MKTGYAVAIVSLTWLATGCSSNDPEGSNDADVDDAASADVTTDAGSADAREASAAETSDATSSDAAPSNEGDAAACSNGDAASWPAAPVVPPAIAVPAGATLKLHAHAIGAQVYTCTASGDAGAAAYAWVLKAPDATLYDRTCAVIGTHGAGPHWTSVDGSTVYGSKVAQADSPQADAIPWLLLQRTSNSGPGVFADVTYVQRVATTLGKAPANGCDTEHVGAETRVGYTADYYFYTGGIADAGPDASPVGTADSSVDGPVNREASTIDANDASAAQADAAAHDGACSDANTDAIVASSADAGDGPICTPVEPRCEAPEPTVPAQIAPPPGAVLKRLARGIGVQIYSCTQGSSADGGAGAYAWTLTAPKANLYDSSCTLLGEHGAGPHWTALDGSTVVGSKVAQVDSPSTGAIPWLLLKGIAHTNAGVFDDVTFVQRLNTSGGKAPAAGCSADTPAAEVRVPYTADYAFFTGGSDAGL